MEALGELVGDAITTGEAFEVLDPEALEALVLEAEMPAFADEIADQLAEDWCRDEHTVDEIVERQRLAGAAIAPVVRLPIPASQLRHRSEGRRAA